VKKKIFGILCSAAMLTCGTAPALADNGAPPEWSDWMSKRGHFQFQVQTEQVTPGVMKVRLRIRPDIATIAAEPYYSGERYYLEYYQAISPDNTGGLGSTRSDNPRRIVFPANAPETCVFEEEDIYAVIDPPGKRNRLYMDRSFSPLPLADQDGTLVSGFEYVLAFGSNTGPGAVTRFTGVPASEFADACP